MILETCSPFFLLLLRRLHQFIVCEYSEKVPPFVFLITHRQLHKLPKVFSNFISDAQASPNAFQSLQSLAKNCNLFQIHQL
ncbi:hypothetical protein L1887_10974 [Cichorium endivia]|nr:hypothetical protein L1887_10974 [Cichorium endivia]